MSLLNFIPPVIAHRGASAYAPENTLAAFHKAVALGAKWIEFDVMPAHCGTPVIFHDDFLERTSNGKGALAHRSYEDLKKLSAGAWFEPQFEKEFIPSLMDMANFISLNKIAANVELKPFVGDEQIFAARVLRDLSTLNLEDGNLLFSSFSIQALYALRKLSPTCLIGLLFDVWQPDWLTISNELNAVSIHVNYQILTPQLANAIKQQQKKLLCYTVNDPALALKLFDWGVDAIFTDVPDRIIAALGWKLT